MNSLQDMPSFLATVQQIRKAIAQVPVAGELHELRIQPRICGVYFLLHGEDVVYVGQSKDIVARVNMHIDEQIKTFDRVLYLPCAQGLLDYYEKRLIALLRPHYNIASPSNRMGVANLVVAELRKAVDGLTFEELLEKAEQQGIWAQTRSSLKRNLFRALQSNKHVRLSEADGRYRLSHPATELFGCQGWENFFAGPVPGPDSASTLGKSQL
jgi:hypothetical protein